MRLYILLLLATADFPAVVPPPSVTAIIQQSVAANQRDWRAATDYDYLESDRDSKGTRTYQVSTILGSPYRRLIAIGGKALAPWRQAEEQRKLHAAIAQRRNESPAKREARIAVYRKERRQERVLLSQLTQAFDFRLLNRGNLDGREVYVLQATPKLGYQPPNRDSKVLTGMQGKLWIDATTFQWMKVRAEVIQPVWIAGFIARVEPGTQFELEYKPVTSEIWLPAHYAMQSRATILFLFNRRNREEEFYYGYRKSDSSGSPAPGRPA